MDGDPRDGQHESVERRSVLRALGAGAVLPGLGDFGLPGGDGLDLPAGDGAVPATTAARNGWYADRAVTDPTTAVTDVAECVRPDQREIYGPTDVNAQTANGRLAVGLTGDGTVSVFRWPRPSYYDQVDYYARGRGPDHEIRVAPNDGAFLGLALDDGDGYETTWLREWDVEQRYADGVEPGEDRDGRFTDVVVTRFDHPDRDLRVEVRDLVPLGGRVGEETDQSDALVRRVRVVHRGPPADRPSVTLVSYENCTLVTSKLPQLPVQDWCLESTSHDVARYRADADAIVHRAGGVDASTSQPQRVAVAMGLAGGSDGHQVGADGSEPTSVGGQVGVPADAYRDASTGTLGGNDVHVGRTTGALSTELSFRGNVATETVVLAAGHTSDAALAELDRVRDAPAGRLVARKESWLADLLADAPMPATDDPRVRTLCRRALVTLASLYDPREGAVVASIATQAPYGEDWPRDGAFFNYVLELLGLHDWVDARNRWYADVQQRADDPRPSHADTPPGNWAMNYYGDGVAGGPIPYEIDETGYTVWTMWDHYRVTGDGAYLRDVYPAIRRAADYLVTCRDPRTGLQCTAWEDDRFVPSQTVVGASAAWLGLRSATRAARALAAGDGSVPFPCGADADRYEARQHELGRAIDAELYDEAAGAYGLTDGGIGFPQATLAWPTCFTPYTDPATGALGEEPAVENPFDHPRIRSHLDTVWETVSPAFDAGTDEASAATPTTGQYEVKGLVPLAMARRADGPGSLGDVRAGIEWIADHHAEPDTLVMGEAWKVFDGEVRSIVSQPHAWEQVLVYLAALVAWPPEDVDVDPATCGSVFRALR